jgi:hypothetical protein
VCLPLVKQTVRPLRESRGNQMSRIPFSEFTDVELQILIHSLDSVCPPIQIALTHMQLLNELKFHLESRNIKEKIEFEHHVDGFEVAFHSAMNAWGKETEELIKEKNRLREALTQVTKSFFYERW